MARRKNNPPESILRDMKRKTRRKINAEDKIRLVLEGLKGDYSIADLCRREGLHPAIYYKWSKNFLEAGKRRFNEDTVRKANTEEVNDLRTENDQFKQLVAELSLKNTALKKP
ncbi:MAG: transposase [Spirochaetes bacterium]|nr:transposase [Spirochaetota bacterium]